MTKPTALSAANIDAKPIGTDWSTFFHGDSGEPFDRASYYERGTFTIDSDCFDLPPLASDVAEEPDEYADDQETTPDDFPREIDAELVTQNGYALDCDANREALQELLEEHGLSTDAAEEAADDFDFSDLDMAEDAEGPMMNFRYPLDTRGDAETAAAAVNGCVCIVETEDGDSFLALTAGGMDLSWEICEAYMQAGSLPPVHFCDLPAMCDRGTSERDLWIIAGCLRSLEIAEGRVARTAKYLRERYNVASEAE